MSRHLKRVKWGSLAPFLLILIALFPMLLQNALLLARITAVAPDGATAALTESFGDENLAGGNLGIHEYRPEEYRLMLLMGLDLLVRFERMSKKEFGSYTQALGRVPDLLGGATLSYRVEITKADSRQFIVMAVGQGLDSGFDARAVNGDELAVDGDFEVRSNFPLPTPPRDYLVTAAKNVLVRLSTREHPEQPVSADEIQKLEGLFHGYFSYERRPRSDEPGHLIWVAVGKGDRVVGKDVIALDPQEIANPPDLFRWVYEYRRSRWAELEARAEMEKIFIAQKIKKMHTGVFSTDLSDIAVHWNSLAPKSHYDVSVQADDVSNAYEAEVAEPGDASNARHWILSSDGKTREKPGATGVEGLVTAFDAARRQIASPEPPQEEGSILINDPSTGKPLFIDVMDSDSDSDSNSGKHFDSSK